MVIFMLRLLNFQRNIPQYPLYSRMVRAQSWTWCCIREKSLHPFSLFAICPACNLVEYVWNLMAHTDTREGKWRGNRRMEWVASTLTLPWNMVYPALLTLMRTPRLPAADWTDAPTDGLVRFDERRNLVSVRVSSRFKRSLHVQN